VASPTRAGRQTAGKGIQPRTTRIARIKKNFHRKVAKTPRNQRGRAVSALSPSRQDAAATLWHFRYQSPAIRGKSCVELRSCHAGKGGLNCRHEENAVVAVDPEIMSGEPCLAGTSIPARALLITLSL
jgi:hypothetical protein